MIGFSGTQPGAAEPLTFRNEAIEVSPDVRRLDFCAWGKHYPAANHFRLINQDIQIASRLKETGLSGWVLHLEGQFAFIFGPTSEAIEIFNRSFHSYVDDTA